MSRSIRNVPSEVDDDNQSQFARAVPCSLDADRQKRSLVKRVPLSLIHYRELRQILPRIGLFRVGLRLQITDVMLGPICGEAFPVD